MKYLGIDFGTKRVGLATSDPEGRMAFPLRTLHRTTRDKLFEEILAVIEDERIEAIVLGLPEGPVAADGQEALIVRQVKNFAKSLERRVSLPLHMMDETLSSLEAERALRDTGIRGQKLKDKLDAHAAALILQAYLDYPTS